MNYDDYRAAEDFRPAGAPRRESFLRTWWIEIACAVVVLGAILGLGALWP